ncbi:MAG: tetratricopeptide repeat protein [Acidiferrobacterales bacterium]
MWVRLSALFRPLTLGRARLPGKWRSHKDAGKKAFRAGNFDEAERHFSAALKHVEPMGERTPRAAATLNNLALVYKRQGKFGKAEICFRRALRIYETLDPHHIHVASVLQNLAGLYRVQGKGAEAEPLRTRARAIVEAGVG